MSGGCVILLGVCQVGVRWVCQVGVPGRHIRWMSGGCVILLGVCVCQVGVRWVCQVGVSSVSASGNIRRVTIGIFGGVSDVRERMLACCVSLYTLHCGHVGNTEKHCTGEAAVMMSYRVT